MDPGSEDVIVGVPIMVTVEEEEDIAAFVDFVVAETAAPPAAEETALEPVVASEPTPVVAAVAPPSPVEAAPVAPVVEEVAAALPDMETLTAAVAPVLSTGWGDFAKINSPILKTLSKQQNDYIAKYGTTGQVPV